MERSGAAKITAVTPPMVAIAALDAMPSLDGLQVNCDVSAGAAAAGYCHSSAPDTASTA